MKLISFALWGQNLKYTIGALRNAALALSIYPGWRCRFYVGQSVPRPIIAQLAAFEHVEVIERPEWGDWRGMFWRFEPASDPDVEVMISRDCDSRLNEREAAAVEAWLKSGKAFHIMRDHPQHRFPVLGGMWGARFPALMEMKALLKQYEQEDAYGTDYIFLANRVLPLVRESVIIHDEFFGEGALRFPVKRKGLEFVGKVYDEHENTPREHEEVLEKWIKQQSK